MMYCFPGVACPTTQEMLAVPPHPGAHEEQHLSQMQLL